MDGSCPPSDALTESSGLSLARLLQISLGPKLIESHRCLDGTNLATYYHLNYITGFVINHKMTRGNNEMKMGNSVKEYVLT